MSTQSQSQTNLILLIIATVVGTLISCFVILIAIFGFVEVRQFQSLSQVGVISTAQVTDSQISLLDCYEVRYEFVVDDQTYRSDDWTDCLDTLQRVQSEQFRTIEVLYLPDQPDFHRPLGIAFEDLGISRFMTACFSIIGLMIFMGLVFGWVSWNQKRNEPEGVTAENESHLTQGQANMTPSDTYPLFTMYESLSKKIGVVDAQKLDGDFLRGRLEKLQKGYAEVDQWVLIEHFGRTPLGEQKVSARFYDGFDFVKPIIASLGVLLTEISYRPDYVAEKLLVKIGVLSFEVQSNLQLPLKPLLSKQLRSGSDVILSKNTDEIADFQVHTFMFLTSLNQKVAVIHHPRYPTSGRYPSAKVLDMIQAELDTQMELQLVVPQKVGRGQQFEVHGSYLTVPLSDLSAESLYCIAKAIHETGLASETIYLADFESDPTLFVDANENVFVNIAPNPRWTRVEFNQ
ncbi:MAG: DUF3592 domain-containing protein [Chloroflexota bacterium]